MALAKGSITVDGNGDASGSGLSKRILDGFLGGGALAALVADLTGSRKAEVVQGMADLAQAISDGVVDELVANGEVTITIDTSDAGLQRLPVSIVASEPTVAPSGDVELTNKGSIA